jgi:hypothetical protein
VVRGVSLHGFRFRLDHVVILSCVVVLVKELFRFFSFCFGDLFLESGYYDFGPVDPIDESLVFLGEFQDQLA